VRLLCGVSPASVAPVVFALIRAGPRPRAGSEASPVTRLVGSAGGPSRFVSLAFFLPLTSPRTRPENSDLLAASDPVSRAENFRPSAKRVPRRWPWAPPSTGGFGPPLVLLFSSSYPPAGSPGLHPPWRAGSSRLAARRGVRPMFRAPSLALRAPPGRSVSAPAACSWAWGPFESPAPGILHGFLNCPVVPTFKLQHRERFLALPILVFLSLGLSDDGSRAASTSGPLLARPFSRENRGGVSGSGPVEQPPFAGRRRRALIATGDCDDRSPSSAAQFRPASLDRHHSRNRAALNSKTGPSRGPPESKSALTPRPDPSVRGPLPPRTRRGQRSPAASNTASLDAFRPRHRPSAGGTRHRRRPDRRKPESAKPPDAGRSHGRNAAAGRPEQPRRRGPARTAGPESPRPPQACVRPRATAHFPRVAPSLRTIRRRPYSAIAGLDLRTVRNRPKKSANCGHFGA